MDATLSATAAAPRDPLLSPDPRGCCCPGERKIMDEKRKDLDLFKLHYRLCKGEARSIHVSARDSGVFLSLSRHSSGYGAEALTVALGDPANLRCLVEHLGRIADQWEAADLDDYGEIVGDLEEVFSTFANVERPEPLS